MSIPTVDELRARRCTPCEGGVPKLTPEESAVLIGHVPDWKLIAEGDRIRRDWRARNFMAAIEFFNKVAELAEMEGHHPDLHLAGYRNVTIEISTHAIGGLSENDFILAAKIDQIPFAVKRA